MTQDFWETVMVLEQGHLMLHGLSDTKHITDSHLQRL